MIFELQALRRWTRHLQILHKHSPTDERLASEWKIRGDL